MTKSRCGRYRGQRASPGLPPSYWTASAPSCWNLPSACILLLPAWWGWSRRHPKDNWEIALGKGAWKKKQKKYMSDYNTPWPLQPHPLPGPKNHLPSVPRLAFWQLSHHCDFGTNLIWNMTEDNTIKKFPTSPCRWDTTCSPAMMQDWGMLQSSRWIPLCSGPPVQPASAWAVHSSAQPPGPSPHWCPGSLDVWYQKGFFNRQGP